MGLFYWLIINLITIINLKLNEMKYTVQSSLTDFRFWAGAKDNNFTYSELKELDYLLEEYGELTETQINDMFWFEDEYLCESIGIDYNEYLKR